MSDNPDTLSDECRSRSPSVTLSVTENHQHEFLLPTPVSPSTNHKDINSFIGQFSLKSPTTDEKIFTCVECGQEFNKAYNLKSHKISHSASKPFQCSECPKTFLRLHDLRRHQKLHTGEKPYRCITCAKCFSRLDALNRHRKSEANPACSKRTSLTQWQIQTPSTSHSPFVLSPSPPPLTNPNDAEMDKLKQRIHDLEIENRVLRSLLEDNLKDNPKRQRSP